MKIAHIVDCMEVGGAETLVAQLSRLQREQGHNPCVYAVATLGVLGEELRQDGLTVQAHVGCHLSDATRNFLRIFKKSRPDVVHLHNPRPTIYAAVAAEYPAIVHNGSNFPGMLMPRIDHISLGKRWPKLI